MTLFPVNDYRLGIGPANAAALVEAREEQLHSQCSKEVWG